MENDLSTERVEEINLESFAAACKLVQSKLLASHVCVHGIVVVAKLNRDLFVCTLMIN